MNFHHSGKKFYRCASLSRQSGPLPLRGHHVLSFRLQTPVFMLLVLQQRACHVHHVHQREGQLALAAVLVRGGFLCGGRSAAQQGDGVFLGLLAGHAFVQGPDLVVQRRAWRVGV